MVNHAAKQVVEEALYESGLDFTILQPAMFMQNLAGSASGMVDRLEMAALASKALGRPVVAGRSRGSSGPRNCPRAPCGTASSG